MRKGNKAVACVNCGIVREINVSRRPSNYCRDCAKARQHEVVGDWADQALCRSKDVDPDWWWPDASHPEIGHIAIGICQSCPVIDNCFTFAINNDETSGIWGGATPEQRRRHARIQSKTA